MTTTTGPLSSVGDLLAHRVARTPAETAVVCGRARVSYAELAARSDEVAARLAGHGAASETRVGLLVERGVDMVVAVFGVLKAGAAYVPLDPAHPARHRAALLADAGVTLVLTEPDLAGSLPPECVPVFVSGGGDRPAVALPRIRPDNLAYVLYTSGSTGQPRGVLGTHRGLLALFAAHHAGIFETARERLRVAHTAALSFDASWDPLLWMLAGHELHVLDRADPRETVAALAAARADVLDATPSHLRMLLLAGLLDGPARPRVVVTGGEPVGPDLGAALTGAGVVVRTAYGTTETTVDSLVGDTVPEGRAVLGRPVAGTRAQVLDAGLRPAAEGELYLAGPGLTRGYLGRPGATAASFVADPAGPPGSRMYRTGDRVRRREDGLLDFLGRADGQVKIRGIRVDPADAEAALLGHPGLAAAAVVARRDGRDTDHLVAYVVPKTASVTGLRAYLRGRVPEHLVPARFVELAALPLTGSGKVDRRALPEPGRPGGDVSAPRNPAEELVADVWREALGLDRVGAEDDFVELGGDSILAMRVAGTLNRRLGTALPAQAVFEHRTVAGLAAALPAAHTGRAPVRTAPGTALPLSSGQERL
ncbi:non-ribosomal peptide synthetase, partial [Amycolatopsis mediterranei]